MNNNFFSSKKNIAVLVSVCVVVIALIAVLAVSCNSKKKHHEDTMSTEETTAASSEESSGETDSVPEESVSIGDNEVPFDDGEETCTEVYVVTKADGSPETEADGTVVTTVAVISDKGDNEVKFDEQTKSPEEADESRAADETGAESRPEKSSEASEPTVEVDKDGWTTKIVKP